MTRTKTEKLLVVLSDGENRTATQLSRRTGLANVAATISRLKGEGFAIYSNRRNDGTVAYRWNI